MTLPGPLTSGEREKLVTLLDQLIGNFERVHRELKKPVPLTHAQLAADMALYDAHPKSASGQDEDRLPAIDRQREAAGSLLESVDVYSACLLRRWAQNASRDALSMRSSVDDVETWSHAFKAMRAALDGKPYAEFGKGRAPIDLAARHGQNLLQSMLVHQTGDWRSIVPSGAGDFPRGRTPYLTQADARIIDGILENSVTEFVEGTDPALLRRVVQLTLQSNPAIGRDPTG